MTMGLLASCDETFDGCLYVFMGEIVCGCLI